MTRWILVAIVAGCAGRDAPAPMADAGPTGDAAIPIDAWIDPGTICGAPGDGPACPRHDGDGGACPEGSLCGITCPGQFWCMDRLGGPRITASIPDNVANCTGRNMGEPAVCTAGGEPRCGIWRCVGSVFTLVSD